MEKLGRRGGFLLLCSVMWVFVALSLPTPDEFGRDVAFPHEILPVIVREIIWLFPATIGAISAFLRAPGQDRWGFILLCLPAAERALSYLIGWIMSLYDYAKYAQLQTPGLTNGLIYSLVVLMIILIASWPEPRTEVMDERSSSTGDN